ncbi:PREDICTED: mavicyanin-like [Nelumbo nucifera]|uniref:Phytocyanin domain-containing protein n=2 Tax=Nelumbo nucifera TaxID=4432 RepID=A0A822YK07_NELNU|nr:PREDICTED: mavicyanin-like [Nelumbo nucifera]DAD31649.1 TPA_asm: hypothetical protein HUJ06_010500 [Nelumbo nucifera]
MASLFMVSSCKVFLVLILVSYSLFLDVKSNEFDVGDDEGWVVPPSKNEQMYNKWASHNRFQVNDTVRFKYKKDSVMVVSESDYDKCHSTQPIFFSNNGDTEITLDHSGLFYFISGVSGHCEKGQKMIIKVLEEPKNDSPPSNQNGTSSSPDQNGAVAMAGFPALTLAQFILSVIGLFFV